MGVRRTCLALSFVVLLVAPAFAQGTGGRMGGGSWGHSSSSSSSSSGYHSSSSSSSSSSGSWGSTYHSSPSSNYHYSGGGGGGSIPPGLLILLVIGGGVFAVVAWLVQNANRGPDLNFMPTFYPSGDSPGFNSVDVSVLRVAIDGRARKFVQTELARIAKSADYKSGITHELASLLSIGDNGVFVDPQEKTMIAQGSPRELLESCQDERVQQFLRRGPTAGVPAGAQSPRKEP